MMAIPLDGMVMMDEPTFPGCVITARPLGMLEMIDGGDRDEKLLCVPAEDPRYAEYTSLPGQCGETSPR